MKLSKGENVREAQKDCVMSNEEIARALGLTVCQVRYSMQEGMRKLREKAKARGLKFEEHFE